MNDKPKLKNDTYSLLEEQVDLITQESNKRRIFNKSATLRQIIDEWREMKNINTSQSTQQPHAG